MQLYLKKTAGNSRKQQETDGKYVLPDRNEEIKIELNLWSTKERMSRLFVFYGNFHLYRTFIGSVYVCLCVLFNGSIGGGSVHIFPADLSISIVWLGISPVVDCF